MAELAQPRQTPRVPARAHQRRQHHSLDEQDWQRTLDNTSNYWALEAIGHRSRRYQNDAHLFIKSILTPLQTRYPTQELPRYIRDPYRGIREIRHDGRFADRSGPGLLPPPRTRALSRAETIEVDEPGTEMSDLGSQQQATGIRRRNGGAEGTADDSAETTATKKRGLTMRIRQIPVEKKPDPDALIWDEINASLKPLLDSLDKDHRYLFLGSGSSVFCRISLVSLGNDKRPVEQWNLIRRAAYTRRGRWHWPRSCGKPRLELVEICALAPHPSHVGDLCGLYQVVSLEGMIRELENDVVEYGSVDYTPGNDVIDRCFYDAKRRRPSHNEYCFGQAGWKDDEYINPDRVYYCGIKEQLERLEEVSKLKAAPLWSAALDNPLLAAGNSLFPSGVVKKYSEIQEEISTARDSGHVRGLAQIKFIGFRVVWPEDEPGFVFTMICCGGVLISCLGVLGFRIAYGDWGTAYTAGAYYVALAGIVLAWFGRQGFLDVFKRMTD